VYCLESDVPERRLFNITDALRTAYRIDIIQPIYFLLENFDQLYELIDIDLLDFIRQMNILNQPKPKHPC